MGFVCWYALAEVSERGNRQFEERCASLGRRLLSATSGANSRDFADTARALLAAEKIEDYTPVRSALDWLILSEDIPRQARLDSGGGDAFITVFEKDDVFIDMHFWSNATTSVHNHPWPGAFLVLKGLSLHTTFAFAHTHAVTPHVNLGTLTPQGASIVKPGSACAIYAGSEFIHSLFHLDVPCVTLVAGRRSNTTEQHYTYARPGLAIQLNDKGEALRQWRCRLALALTGLQGGPYAYDLAFWQQLLDGEERLSLAITLLVKLASFIQNDSEWQHTCSAFEAAWEGDASSALIACANDERLIRRLRAARLEVRKAGPRFLLACLMNIRDRAYTSRLVEEFLALRGETGTAEAAMGDWASELSATSLVSAPLTPPAKLVLGGLLQGNDEQVLVRRVCAAMDHPPTPELEQNILTLGAVFRTHPLWSLLLTDKRLEA